MGAEHPEPAAARSEPACSGGPPPRIRHGGPSTGLHHRPGAELRPVLRLLATCAVLTLAGAVHAAELLGSYRWDYDKPYFGGLSGIEIDESGTGFVVIGDAGQLIFGSLLRDDGRITGVDFDQVKSLHTPSGRRVTGIEEFDAEGLALTPDGRLYVSFEHDARVWSYDDWLGRATPLPSHSDFAGFPKNGGPEALAIGPDSTLYTMPERTDVFRTGRTVYRFREGAWEKFGTVDTTPGFWPVGSDIGPDGMFYLLERRYLPLAGFATRVRRFRIGGDGLEDPEILLETSFGAHDNLEGIAVWRDAAGRIRLTMVSDDNNSRFQRTEIVEYAVPDALDAGQATR